MKLRIVLVHNHYQQAGGEDHVFAAEASLLRDRGHSVTFYTRHNDDVSNLGSLGLARATVWNHRTYSELRDLVRAHRADVVHIHNTLPLISPAAYHAARAGGAAVVQSLHNFRLYCPSAQFWRNGRPCEDCVGKAVPFPGIIHACYRNSRTATGAIAAMLAVHRGIRTWTRKVDAFIAPSEFVRQKLIRCGMAPEKLVVKHHFVPDTGVGGGSGGNALFVGRLAQEKGLRTLITAAEAVGAKLPLTVVGDGPLAGVIEEAASRIPWVEWLGSRAPEDVYRLMGQARVVVVPSESYETFGRVVAEAYSKGTPVIASRSGALTEIVKHGATGLLFKPGDAEDLAAQMDLLCESQRNDGMMRRAARVEYEANFTPDANYDRLLGIYGQTIRSGRTA